MEEKWIKAWSFRLIMAAGMVSLLGFSAHAGCNTVIGNKVWNDSNGNGIQDADEPGIQGVTVNLIDMDNQDEDSTVTDENGLYSFTGNCYNHTYQITVDESTLPSEIDNASPCHNESSSDSPYDKDSNCNGQKILLGYNEINESIDFGYYKGQIVCEGAIGDYIWNDSNRDGIQNPDEQGINGVTVVVTDDNGDEYTSITSTGGPLDKPGFYQIGNLCEGSYDVAVKMGTVPDNMDITLIETGSNPAKDSDDPTGTTVALTANDQVENNIDFGFYTICSGQIGDYIWNDDDRDGIQDSDEQGINGVKVIVEDSSDTTKTVTSFTGGPQSAPGYYAIDGLCADTYTIKVDATSVSTGLNPTEIGAGNNSGLDSNDPNGTEVILSSDSSKDNTIDFGYKTACSGSVGDYVWNDTNHNGIQDNNEQGLNSISLVLTSAKSFSGFIFMVRDITLVALS